MSNIKISQLVERTVLANTDVLPIVYIGATLTNKVTISTIQNWMQTNLNFITSLTGEATGIGPGATAVTLNNSAVIGKLLTGLSITGSAISSSDNILTAFGKVQNQINGLIGGVQFQGVWNAATNTPALVSSVGTQGYYYIVSVAGNTNLNGITDWQVGDWAIFNGSTWNKVDNTDLVTSVNGQIGAVSLTTDNIPEGATNLYYLDSRARAALSFAAGSGAYSSTTGVITIPTDNSQILNGAGYITLASLSGTAPISYNSGTGAISITQSGTASNGYLSSTDWTTFNNKQATITLTTTGTSGASTLVGATLNIPNYADAYVGTVTSVAALTLGTTGTDLSSTVATGTTTPVITLNVPTASATNRGALSSADWTTFNNKAPALSGTTNYLPKFTSASTIGNSQIFDNGTNVGIGTASPNEKLTVNGNINITNNAERYIYLDTDNTGTGKLIIQAGGGSSAYGGAINLFSNAHATKAGWVSVGLSSNSVSKFTVNSQGLAGGTDLFTVLLNGNTLLNSTTDAGYKLDVNGTGRFSGALTGTSANFISSNAAGVLGVYASASGRGVMINPNLTVGQTSIYSDYLGGAEPTLYLATYSNRSNGLGITLNTTGNVLIGTTTDAGYKLSVNGTANFSGALTGTSAEFQVTDAGVGTKTIVATFARTGATSSGTAREAGIVFRDNANTTLSSGITGVRENSSGNYLSGLKFYVNSNSSTPASTFADLTEAFSINSSLAATFSSSVTATNLYSTGASNLATTSGNVGIGTASPNGKLDVLGTKTTALATADDFLTMGLLVDDATTGYAIGVGGGIVFRGKRNTSGNQTIYGAIDGIKANAGEDDYVGAIRFFTNQNSTGVPLERVRIAGTGNLLVGTTTDAGYKLSVNGTANFSGALTGTSATFSGNVGIGLAPIIASGGAFSQIFIGGSGQGGVLYGQNNAGSVALVANGYFNASNLLKYINSINGVGEIYNYNGEFIFSNAPVGTSGNTVTLTPRLTIASTGAATFSSSVTATGATFDTLEVNSTTKGFLPPRMTTVQKNAITSLAAGMIVYDTTLNKLCVYTTAWETITSL